MDTRRPYNGSTRKLVLAFDVGTTYSGISYSLLDPGHPPVIKGVTKFPAQGNISGASKIPSQIIYDERGQGRVRAVGAEAVSEGMAELCEENSWVRVEWFKLHLCPGENPVQSATHPLPPGKTIVHVLADFYRYLMHCAKTFICETHATGKALWDTIQNHIYFVLSHPNGWSGLEQYKMRQAAVMAGLVPEGQEHEDRISFVSEGEASLHFAIQSGVLRDSFQKGEGAIIVDAGGGTIDISAYRNNIQKGPTAFEEIAVAKSEVIGSLVVNMHAKEFLQKHLANSPYLEDLDLIVQKFDETTKRRFSNDRDPQYIKFGTSKDNDAPRNIKFGQLKLSGADVTNFFLPSLEWILETVGGQRQQTYCPVTHVVLVGGFSANDWIFKQIETRLSVENLAVIRPDNPVNKAVSDGAVSFYIDHYVRSRVSRAVYGIFYTVNYNPSNPKHTIREHLCVKSMAGEKLLPNAFSIILKKGVQVQEEREFRKDFFRIGRTPKDFCRVTSTVHQYRGALEHPEWRDVDTDNYLPLCTISADLSGIPTRRHVSSSGKEYLRIDYDIVILFGLTEVKAYFAWMNNGVEERGPAKLIY